jgi:putative IMPACT (imprinted ancient) family translation regulator
VQQQESRASTYTTLAAGQEFRHEIEVKRSRFITVLRRADSEAVSNTI